MNPTAIYSKTGKGVQEASGKTSILSRADRVVLSAIDGKSTVGELNHKFDKIPEARLHQLIEQMDKDGFIRATTQGSAAAQKTATIRPEAAPARPAAAAAGEDLDFTAPSIPAIRVPATGAAAASPPAAAPKPAAPRSAIDLAAAARTDAQAKLAAEADVKIKAARDAAVRMAAEAKAKAEAQAKAAAQAAQREAQAAKQAAEKAAGEADALRKQLEEERAKAEAERRVREEEERKRREEEGRRRKEEDERRAREEQERAKAAEADRRAKEEAERRAKDQAEAKRREEDARLRREESEHARADEERRAKAAAPSAPAPAAPAATPGLDDSFLADLDNFGKRAEEEQKALEEAERKAKVEKQRAAQQAAERQAKEEAERKQREEDERRAHEEMERVAREQEELAAREAEDRKRKAQELVLAAASAAKPKDADDIPLSDDDLDMDEVKQDEKALSQESRKAARERERGEKRAREKAPEAAVVAAKVRKPVKWGKSAAIGAFVLLAGGLGALHLMPIGTADYEQAATEALGVPVKVGGARMSLVTGAQVKLERITVGDGGKIANATASVDFGSLFGPKKTVSRLDLEGAVVPQALLGGALFGAAKGDSFKVTRVVAKGMKLDGPLALPTLDYDATIGADGKLRALRFSGDGKVSGSVTPRASDAAIELTAGSFAVPVIPGLTLNDFGLKGLLLRDGLIVSEFDSRLFDGVIAGNGRMRWGQAWVMEGEVRLKNVNAAVFAPALISEGRLEARGRYTMSAPEAGKLYGSLKVDGNFTVTRGVIGSFDIARAVQAGGQQTGGRTQVSEFGGKAIWDKGALSVRDVAISAGAMNAAIALDIDKEGGLSGRLVADLKTPAGVLRGNFSLGGTYKDPTLKK